jgi:hypothetical protein
MPLGLDERKRLLISYFWLVWVLARSNNGVRTVGQHEVDDIEHVKQPKAQEDEVAIPWPVLRAAPTDDDLEAIYPYVTSQRTTEVTVPSRPDDGRETSSGSTCNVPDEEHSDCGLRSNLAGGL